MMTRKELIEKIASEYDLPAGKARKIVDSILLHLVQSGLNGDGFVSSIANLRTRVVPAQVVYDKTTGEMKQVPEQKRMILIPTQQYLSSNAG